MDYGEKMKICNRNGCGVCVNCDGTPPIINGYKYGDICRKTAQNIIDCLESGDLYRFCNGKLYRVEIDYDSTIEEELEI